MSNQEKKQFYVRGCFHKNRPASKNCANCGEPLCYECFIEKVIGKRITASTSVDREVRTDFGFFCPACYLNQIKNEKPPSKPHPLNIFSFDMGFATSCFIILIIPLLVGCMVWFAGYYEQKEKYQEWINKKKKAERLLYEGSST